MEIKTPRSIKLYVPIRRCHAHVKAPGGPHGLLFISKCTTTTIWHFGDAISTPLCRRARTSLEHADNNYLRRFYRREVHFSYRFPFLEACEHVLPYRSFFTRELIACTLTSIAAREGVINPFRLYLTP
jgi:hypothetical protein